MKYFTFQSGSIQIFPRHCNTNAVIFFTFQSGSIQISLSDRNKLEFNVFTFQSGSIQIKDRYGRYKVIM